MNKQQFLNKLNKKINKFEKLHYEIVALIREFTFDKENINTIDCAYELRNLDKFCFTYAWIIDQLNGNSGIVGGKGYNKSMSKKIRKAMGYTV